MIKSMTAYATTTTQGKWGTIIWEMRSLNHRYLDISFRIPEIFHHIEPELRKFASSELSRGKIECILKYHPKDSANVAITVNHSLVKQIAKAVKETGKHFDNKLANVNPLQLLSWNNAVEILEQNPKALNRHITTLFKNAITTLGNNRKKEGAALKQIIQRKLQRVDKQIIKAEKIWPKVKKNYRSSLLQRLESVADKLNTDRLEQEMVYFAQKIDVAEELDRLKAHTSQVAKILTKGGATGKKLDFFMQELNREANTLASKASDNRLTNCAVELKVLIEQMREQIQNIE